MFYLGRGRLGIAFVFVSVFIGYSALYGARLLEIEYPDWVATLVLLTYRTVGAVYVCVTAAKQIPLDRYPWFARTYNWLLLLFVAPMLIAILIRNFAIEPFSIPANSMRPTLQEGDYVFSEKLTYGIGRYSLMFGWGPSHRFGGRSPKRGEIVIFAFPPEPTTSYVKRVIGLPGDRIQMRDGRLFINRIIVERKPSEADNIELQPDEMLYTEYLPGGIDHQIIETSDTSRGDTTSEFLVPEGHYFVIGDNRDNSLDSRFNVGFVPEENIASRPFLIFSSSRADRFWRSVQ